MRRRAQKSALAARRLLGRAKGFALIMLLVIVTMGSLALFLSNLTPSTADFARQKKTAIALEEARVALIGYALRYTVDHPDSVYGYLPVPDVGTSRMVDEQKNSPCNTEGCAVNFLYGQFPEKDNTIAGRLPWRTLGTGPIRDGYEECLWYIVSGHHKSIDKQPAIPMNWDTLGHLDVVVANGSDSLNSLLTSARDRPVAIIFSPGPPLPSQNRADLKTDDVSQCGGNYDAQNYLDPYVAINGVANYLAGTNHSSSATGDTDQSNDPGTPKQILTHGKLVKEGANYRAGNCGSGACDVVSNDVGEIISSQELFAKIRERSDFRSAIDGFVKAMGECLESTANFTPTIMTGTANAYRGKYPTALCSSTVPSMPPGYFDNYKEQVLVATIGDASAVSACKAAYNTPGKCLDVTAFDKDRKPIFQKKCRGVLLLGGQPNATQFRSIDADRAKPANYLEGINLSSFVTSAQPVTSAQSYSGTSNFLPVTRTITADQDVVRCIPEAGYSNANPTGVPFLSVQNAALDATGGQLTAYDETARTITLGRPQIAMVSALQTDLYGCTWAPETHALNHGLRSYFKFRINDALDSLATVPAEGFVFAIVDGDKNGVNACGAARQHLGYSGNNNDTPYVKPPKIGIEFDFRRNFSGTTGFNPSGANTLTNGRNDPSSTTYNGGHVGIVYWGGEVPISTTRTFSSCTSPRYWSNGVCYLPPEEDDNVHGYPSGCSNSPANPAAPASPTLASGVYKLDPNLSQVPTNQDFHLRVEVTRASSSNTAAPSLPWVRVASTSNITLASPGSTIDGITLVTADRILVKNQSTATDNGIYVWNGATSPMTRATDADTLAKRSGMLIQVIEGSSPRAWWQASVDASSWNLPSSVRVAAQTKIDDISAPGATIDGCIALNSGDRILLTKQTDSKQNGIYIWQGASSALIRASDTDSAAELANALTKVAEGTDIDRTFRQITKFTDSDTIDLNDSKGIQWQAIDPDQFGTKYRVEAWILPDGNSTEQIAAMKNTSHPMSTLYPTFTPHLSDLPSIYYPFSRVRLGFTIGQSTSRNDQTILISDYTTSWLQ